MNLKIDALEVEVELKILTKTRGTMEAETWVLGPDSAEHPQKPYYKTQNLAKRFNRLDNRNRFGTRGRRIGTSGFYV